MDIIDVILARAITPEGQADQAAAIAQQAAADAAASALEASNAASELSSALDDMESTMSAEIKKMTFALSTEALTGGTGYNLDITYPDNTSTSVDNIIKLYNSIGQNTDGTINQDALTSLFNEIGNAINELSSAIDNIEVNNLDISASDAEHLITVNEDGEGVASTITEADIIKLLIETDNYSESNTFGLEIDYANKSYKRVLQSKNFNNYDTIAPFGGRMRCNVSDSGEIVAWYGDETFKDDGSNGQVMVYQPKFYYMRIPLVLENNKTVRKEIIVISADYKPGFVLHPLFYNSTTSEELDYVLLSAYEGCLYKASTNTYDMNDGSSVNWSTDKLSSIAGAKPISGANKELAVQNAEQLAENRGAGWYITDMAYESAEQMLMAVEFGTLNMQSAIEAGVVNISTVSNYNCSSITGSTASKGNATGAASSTINEINGTSTTYNQAGKRAITYRGVENPWGNIWRMIGKCRISGTGTQGGGRFRDSHRNITRSYNISNTSSWISAFGFEGENDYIFLPIECSNANSALPVGDNLWVNTNNESVCAAMAGGAWSFNDSCGPFFYAFDHDLLYYSQGYGARIMFIPPAKNTIYNNNIASWQEHFNNGGD